MSLALDPPEHLSDGAKAEWIRLVAAGLAVSEVSRGLLETYCAAYALWRESEVRINTDGAEIVTRDDKGVVKAIMPSPWLGIGEKAYSRMLRSGDRLGISVERGRGTPIRAADDADVGAEWFQ